MRLGRATYVLTCLSVTALAGCSQLEQPLATVEQGEAIARQCMAETAAPGAYSVRAAQHSTVYDNRLPHADPIENLGGTDAGAAALNACIRTKIAVRDAGTGLADPVLGHGDYIETTQSDYDPMAGCTAGSSVLQGGSSYCIKRGR